jgi:D-alanyl-D-alanine carboxypeptidase
MSRFIRSTATTRLACAAAVALPLLVPAVGQARTTDAEVQRGLRRLVAARGGAPGAVATLYRDGRLTVLRAGRANVRRAGAPTANQHMRIASIAKAFSGAVALHLVQEGRLGLDDTLGQRLPSAPAAWSAVTIRQLLNHTSGIPDYTRSDGFAKSATRDPRAYISPQEVVGFVRRDPLAFAPGSRYEYSNTDNILIGLIAESITSTPYPNLLQQIVFGPAGLKQTSFPTRRLTLPAPFIHGYVVAPGEAPQDTTSMISPSGAWASGAIVSTPRDLSAFIRADLGRRFFGAAEQEQQMQFVRGSSSPPGPGTNAAGLALFRYTSRCGVVYGHTGSFPGYAQWAAATADGSASVTTTLNIPPPTGALLRQLRSVQADAVCALLGR